MKKLFLMLLTIASTNVIVAMQPQHSVEAKIITAQQSVAATTEHRQARPSQLIIPAPSNASTINSHNQVNDDDTPGAPRTQDQNDDGTNS